MKCQGCGILHGDVPVDERQAVVSSFQCGTDMNVLLCNPGVAGTGYTLTAANYAVYETIGWRLAVRSLRAESGPDSQDWSALAGDLHQIDSREHHRQRNCGVLGAKSASGIRRPRSRACKVERNSMGKTKFLEMVSSGHLPND